MTDRSIEAPPAFEAIVQLIAKMQSIPPEQIRPSSRLEADLRITGDDGADLLKAFAERFDIDVSQVDGAYFHSEALLSDHISFFGFLGLTIGVGLLLAGARGGNVAYAALGALLALATIAALALARSFDRKSDPVLDLSVADLVLISETGAWPSRSDLGAIQRRSKAADTIR